MGTVRAADCDSWQHSLWTIGTALQLAPLLARNNHHLCLVHTDITMTFSRRSSRGVEPARYAFLGTPQMDRRLWWLSVEGRSCLQSSSLRGPTPRSKQA